MNPKSNNFSISSFPMGPNLRQWFGISQSDYRGFDNTLPTAEELACFSEIFLVSLEERTPQNENHFVDILEELVGMNVPLLAVKFVDSYPSVFPHDDFRAQLHYGNAAMLVGDLARAESAFVTAQRLIPEEPAPYVNLVQIYAHDNLLAKAREWCLAGLDADCENSRLWEFAAWLEQNENPTNTNQKVGKKILDLAKQKNSWTGTSLAFDLMNPEDAIGKAHALEAFWNSGIRDTKFLIEYTAVLGVAGHYDKIPSIVWHTQKGEKPSWQLLMHLAQANLGLGRDDDALEALDNASKCNDLPDDARSVIASLRSEIPVPSQPLN